MQTFRILYFRDSILDHAEEVEVRDMLDAIDQASNKEPHIRVEVWSEDKRVGEINATPNQCPRSS